MESWTEITEACQTNKPDCWTTFDLDTKTLQLKTDWADVAKAQQFWQIRLYNNGVHTGYFRRNPGTANTPDVIKFKKMGDENCGSATTENTLFKLEETKKKFVWTIFKNSTYLKIFVDQDLYIEHKFSTLESECEDFMTGDESMDQMSFIQLVGSHWRGRDAGNGKLYHV